MRRASAGDANDLREPDDATEDHDRKDSEQRNVRTLTGVGRVDDYGFWAVGGRRRCGGRWGCRRGGRGGRRCARGNLRRGLFDGDRSARRLLHERRDLFDEALRFWGRCLRRKDRWPDLLRRLHRDRRLHRQDRHRSYLHRSRGRSRGRAWTWIGRWRRCGVDRRLNDRRRRYRRSRGGLDGRWRGGLDGRWRGGADRRQRHCRGGLDERRRGGGGRCCRGRFLGCRRHWNAEDQAGDHDDSGCGQRSVQVLAQGTPSSADPMSSSVSLPFVAADAPIDDGVDLGALAGEDLREESPVTGRPTPVGARFLGRLGSQSLPRRITWASHPKMKSSGSART